VGARGVHSGVQWGAVVRACACMLRAPQPRSVLASLRACLSLPVGPDQAVAVVHAHLPCVLAVQLGAGEVAGCPQRPLQQRAPERVCAQRHQLGRAVHCVANTYNSGLPTVALKSKLINLQRAQRACRPHPAPPPRRAARAPSSAETCCGHRVGEGAQGPPRHSRRTACAHTAR